MAEVRDPEVQAFLDKQAISEAVTRSSHGLDRCNVDVLKSAYWPDATVAYGMFEGLAWEFADFVMGGLKEYDVTQHQLSNILIELS
ncbi:MAG: nuclear transport factor 2 family protein, partial [Pseudomonadota bacterium]